MTNHFHILCELDACQRRTAIKGVTSNVRDTVRNDNLTKRGTVLERRCAECLYAIAKSDDFQ